MIQWREKWLSALLFAVFLHLFIGLIFYINYNKNGSSELNLSRENDSIQLTTDVVIDENPPRSSKDYVATLNGVEPTPNPDDYLEASSTTSKKTIDDERSISENPSDNSGSIDQKIVSSKNLQENNRYTADDSKKFITTTLENNYTLEEINKDIVLLNIDKPGKNETTKSSTEYQSLKLETEEINSQLSGIIDEVKKRNQQKINKIQQERNPYIHNNESKDLSIKNNNDNS